MKKHYVAGIISLSLLLSLVSPVFAEESASTTPETILPSDPIIETATSTSPSASSTEPIASSTEPIASSTIIFTALASDTASSSDTTASSTSTSTASSTESTSTSTEQTATSTQIYLRIETADKTLFNQSIDVLPCQPTETSATTTNGYCAVMQSGIPSEWSFGSFGAMLNSLGGYVGDWTKYWLWFENSQSGMSSLDSHVLAPGEHLLLTYGENGLNPLRLTAATTTIESGATTTLSVTSPGFDETWSPVFVPVASTTLFINNSSLEIASSSLDWSTTTPGTYSMYAMKNGYVSSDPLVITVLTASQSTSTATTTTTGGSSGTSGTTGGSSGNTGTFNVDQAIAFLEANQRSDGSFGNSLYTDWAAIAFASYPGASQAREKIKTYLVLNSETSQLTTDNIRHAMALMALGIDPYSGTSINYIKKITDSFDGNQIGDPYIYNDDIFAIFPLMKAGYTISDEIIKKSVHFIVTNQGSNGSFMGADLTAAAIQALRHVESLNGVPEAITKAENYLRSQQSNGGFGSSYATSWSLQAIYALGLSPSSWSQNSETPVTYLAKLQQTDGGIESTSVSLNDRIWATSYAIPAVLGKPWRSILSSYPKPFTAPVTTNIASTTSATSTATITTPTATTTPMNATTTIRQATTTRTTLVQKPTPVLKITKLATTSQESVLGTTTSSTTVSDTVTITPTSTQFAAAGSSGTTWPYTTIMAIIALVVLGYGIYRYKS